MATPKLSPNEIVARHHEATAAKHRAYSATVGVENEAILHLDAADNLMAVAAELRLRK